VVNICNTCLESEYEYKETKNNAKERRNGQRYFLKERVLDSHILKPQSAHYFHLGRLETAKRLK
jgi:hypothetical protein